MSDETNIEVIKAEVMPVALDAAAMVVTNAEQYAVASEFLKTIKGAQKKVVDFFAPMKQKAHEAHKAITQQESATLKPLQDAETSLKRNLLTFYNEQERIRQEEQRKLQAAADEAARKEREKAESAARLQREKEAAARAEQERQERLAAQARNEVERQRAAEAAESARKQAEAAAAKAEFKEDTAASVIAPVVAVASVAPVVSGQSIRKTWTAKVVNLELVPREWLVVNEKALDAFAKSTKGAVKVAGVEFVEVSSLASSGR